jgi:hypothetical protein
MRARTSLCLLACCCAALAACTAAPHKGPDTTVTTPAVGRPLAPQSVQAALASEAFTPYTEILPTTDDGLASGDTMAALHTACMNDAGYGQYANNTPYLVMGAPFDFNIWQPFGWWGYIGTAEAAQSGFNVNPPVPGGGPNNPPPGLPASATAAWGKCFTIVAFFQNAQSATSLAGINTLSNDLANDMARDRDVKDATKAWAACMARNGYTAPDPNTLANQEDHALGLVIGPDPTLAELTPVQNKAQIAEAVADADCTRTTDLAGIYFAVQASYAQQLATANQQALGAAVRQYKASYAKELAKLPALLRTTSATPRI